MQDLNMLKNGFQLEQLTCITGSNIKVANVITIVGMVS